MAANSATPATSRSCTSEMSAKPARIFTAASSQAVVSRETGDGLVGDGRQRGWIEREIRREPGVLRQRQHMAERGTFGDAARDEIRRLQRKLRRAPALRQSGELAPIGRILARLPRAPRPAAAGRDSDPRRAGRAAAAPAPRPCPPSRHQRWPMESSALASALVSRSRAATRLASSVTATESAPSLRIGLGPSPSIRSADIIAAKGPV